MIVIMIGVISTTYTINNFFFNYLKKKNVNTSICEISMYCKIGSNYIAKLLFMCHCAYRMRD